MGSRQQRLPTTLTSVQAHSDSTTTLPHTISKQHQQKQHQQLGEKFLKHQLKCSTPSSCKFSGITTKFIHCPAKAIKNTKRTLSKRKVQSQENRSQQHRYHFLTMCTVVLYLFILSLLHTTAASPVFVDNPSLAQFQSGRNIRHLPCIVRKSGRSGVCMFAIDCIKQNGTHLGTCIDRFYFGSCCHVKDDVQLFAPEISDNSIDQNTISHFVHESTTLPTSALFKLTTESPTSTHNTNNNANIVNELIKNVTQTFPSTKLEATTTSTSTKSPSTQRPRPSAPISTTQKASQFVVRTTAKPGGSKPTRRKPATTVTPIVLTTNLPTVEERVDTTTLPTKFFTFQIVETTTSAATMSSKVEEISTTNRPTLNTSRPRPTVTNGVVTHRFNTTAITTPITTTNRPATPVRNTNRPSSSSSKKPTHTKRPSQKPTSKPTTGAANETIKPGASSSSSSTTKPVRKPPPPSSTHPSTSNKINTTPTSTSSSSTSASPTHTPPKIPTQTTHAPRPKPKPTAQIVKVPETTIRTEAPRRTTTEVPPTTQFDEKTTIPIQSTTSTPPKPKPIIASTTIRTTTTTTSPPSSTTEKTIRPTTDLPKIPSTPAPPTKVTTQQPVLVTWTNLDAEPKPNVTSSDEEWQPKPPPPDWIPVSTLAPESANTISTEASTTTATTPSTTTQKVIVSISSSVSEIMGNSSDSKPIKLPKPKPPKPTPPSSIVTKPKPTKTTASTATSSTIVTTSTIASTTTTTTERTTATQSTAKPLTVITDSPTTMGLDVTTGNVSITTELPLEDNNGTISLTTIAPANSLEGIDYREICGRRMFPEPRIVGGSNAAFGRWPWQISLRQWRTSTYLHKCGAALLNENWAITAAHCVDNVPPSDLLLRLGEYDLAEEEEPYGYQERRVQIVASHPQFDPRTFEYDLALLRFYEPVIFQPNIIPVCVPNSDQDFIGQTAFVTGWGRLYEDGPLPSVLQEVAVPVINNTICESMYRAAGYIEHIPHIFICAGWKKGGYDSCEGDSGGPMVLQREDDKRFQLGGVISWGIGCAEANQPGVYTRISEFRDWINQILQF